MTDETTKSTTEPEQPNEEENTESGTAVATVEEEEGEQADLEKVNQTVDVSDVGPCKKHIKVTVERSTI